MKKSLLLVVAVVTDWSSGLAHSTALPLTILLLFLPTPATSSVDIRGGFGERQPGLEYDAENPLFNLNVLITGVQMILCPLPLSVHVFVHVAFCAGCLQYELSGPFVLWCDM